MSRNTLIGFFFVFAVLLFSLTACVKAKSPTAPANLATDTPTVNATTTATVNATGTASVASATATSVAATETATAQPTATPDCTLIFGNYNTSFVSGLWSQYLIGSPFVANATTTVNTIRLVFASGETCIAGIYTDNGGVPGTLLGQTAVTSTVDGNWTYVPLLAPVAVTSGTTYWIISEGEFNYGAIMGSGGASTVTKYVSELWVNVASGMPSNISALGWTAWGSPYGAELSAYNCQ
jgi:hypothetical protein